MSGLGAISAENVALNLLGTCLDALDALLEASWPVQVAEMPPEESPRGSKVDSQRRLALKTRFPEKVLLFHRIFMNFEVPGHSLGAQNR